MLPGQSIRYIINDEALAKIFYFHADSKLRKCVMSFLTGNGVMVVIEFPSNCLNLESKGKNSFLFRDRIRSDGAVMQPQDLA